MNAQPALDDVLGPPAAFAAAALLSSTPREAESLKANTDLAIEFLDNIDRGRHDLYAIDPYKGPRQAKTILATQRDDGRKWIDANQGRRNLYYAVNRAIKGAPLNERLAHKNDRREIGWRRAFVADLDMKKLADPNPDNVKSEQKRLRDAVCEIAASACPPTLVINTGGNFQLLWLLETPMPVTPENEALDNGIGRAIQQRHGGDFVADLPRVLRLPGTINILSPEKREQGREPAVVEIEYALSGGKKYTLEQMKAAFPPLYSPPGKKDTKRPDIDMGIVYQTQIDNKLPNDLQKRFDAARSQHGRLRLLWDGAIAPGDGSPSAFEFELVGWLKQFEFTLTECAQIVSLWNQQSIKHADELERRVGNCWINNPAPAGGEGFEQCERAEADGPFRS